MLKNWKNDILRTEKESRSERIGDIVWKVLKKKLKTINAVMKALTQRFMEKQ